MMEWFCAARRHLRPLVVLCLAGVLVAHAEPAKRFIKISFNLDPDPDGMSLKGSSETWYKYPALFRWVSEAEVQQGKVELGTLAVTRKLYAGAEFSLPPIELENARLDASAWEEMTPNDAGSAEPGWANDSHDGVPCLARWYKCKKPVVLEWDRKIYLTLTTEPQGARAYVNGRFVDSVPATGLTFSYPLRTAHFKQGYVLGDSFTLVRYGYLPKPVQYRFELDSAKERTQSDIQRYESFKLVRDASVPAQSLVPPADAQPAGAEYDRAVAEYEQALVEWESAMRGCGKAGLDAKAIDQAAAGGKAAPGSGYGSPARDEAARRLRAARESRDRAMAQLRSLQSK